MWKHFYLINLLYFEACTTYEALRSTDSHIDNVPFDFLYSSKSNHLSKQTASCCEGGASTTNSQPTIRIPNPVGLCRARRPMQDAAISKCHNCWRRHKSGDKSYKTLHLTFIETLIVILLVQLIIHLL